jgi:hypothetical protein
MQQHTVAGQLEQQTNAVHQHNLVAGKKRKVPDPLSMLDLEALKFGRVELHGGVLPQKHVADLAGLRQHHLASAKPNTDCLLLFMLENVVIPCCQVTLDEVRHYLQAPVRQASIIATVSVR